MIQFTCPECGSHHFGSSKLDSGELERQCHGDICGFKFNEKDDAKYFRDDGPRSASEREAALAAACRAALAWVEDAEGAPMWRSDLIAQIKSALEGVP